MSYYAFEGLIPVVHPTAFVHPSAVLIGDVIVGAGVYIGPLASLRGDYGRLNTKEYQDLVGRCHAALRETQPLTQMEENRPRLQGTTDVAPKR
ncbi:hypothetical protein [Escherichia albertii]|uniref:hypothetical protein n=1 Tax=Escherichia albertii TaxID=208962 RepID=UPI000CF70A2D|nr:hypothetical protein [Escherichia albertii]